MSKNVGLSPQKILLIRMLSESDVLAIGLPALRFFKQKFPDAEIHFLTYGQGTTILKFAEPDVQVSELTHWPDDFFQAMEVFLGLAEDIVGEAYSQIVNLDTAFMPCFLARFLQDAGEPVSGNYLSLSIQTLIDQVKDQSLNADYVNVPSTYMLSSFFTMSRWFSNWAFGDYMPDGGYPEFYLKQCCGFSSLQMDTSIKIADQSLTPDEQRKMTISLCFSQSEDGYLYPHHKTLSLALEKVGFTVWHDNELGNDRIALLRRLQKSDLVVCKPSAYKWFADAADCPSLLISGSVDPKIFMPDFATEPTASCPVHSGQTLSQYELSRARCLCDDPKMLADNIVSILQKLNGTAQHD
jgi:hypothetical protein